MNCENCGKVLGDRVYHPDPDNQTVGLCPVCAQETGIPEVEG